MLNIVIVNFNTDQYNRYIKLGKSSGKKGGFSRISLASAYIQKKNDM